MEPRQGGGISGYPQDGGLRERWDVEEKSFQSRRGTGRGSPKVGGWSGARSGRRLRLLLRTYDLLPALAGTAPLRLPQNLRSSDSGGPWTSNRPPRS